jgi:hypothetical protein
MDRFVGQFADDVCFHRATCAFADAMLRVGLVEIDIVHRAAR